MCKKICANDLLQWYRRSTTRRQALETELIMMRICGSTGPDGCFGVFISVNFELWRSTSAKSKFWKVQNNINNAGTIDGKTLSAHPLPTCSRCGHLGRAPSKDPFFFSKECDEDAELLNFEVLSGCGLLLWLPYLYCRSDVVTWQRFFGAEMPGAFGAFGPFAKVIVESRFEIHVDIHRLEPQHLSGRFHEFHGLKSMKKVAKVQNVHCRYWEMLSAGVGKNQTDVFFYFYFSKIFPTKSTLWKNGSPTAKSRCVPISDPTFCRPWCRRGIPIHLSPESPSGDS